jgi:hypothetical protein
MKIVASSLSAESGEIFNFKVSRFFQIVVVRDDVRVLLAPDRRRGDGRCNEEEDQDKK